jgi:hypothetical protein
MDPVTPIQKRFLFYFGAGLVVYTLVGFFLAPQIVRSILLHNLEAQLTTTPTLGDVRVNPFALSVTLRNFSIPDRRGGAAIAFDELYLRASVLSPFFRAWTLSELRLVKPYVKASILEDRTLNLFHLLRKPPGAPDSSNAEPPAILVRKLRIVDGGLAFEDRSRTPVLKKSMIPIRIDLRDFSTRRDRENGYSFQASTDRGEQLTWRGRFRLRPFTSEGDIRVDGLQAFTLEDLLGPVNPYQFIHGTIGLTARYRVDASRTPPAVGLTDMGISARDLVLVDRSTGEDVVAADSLDARGGTVNANALHANLGQVSASGARVVVWMNPDGITNLQRWAQPAAVPDTAAPWVTIIPRLEARGTEVLYQDRRVTPPPEFRAHAGRVEMNGFSTQPGTVSQLSAACSLGTSGWVEASGTLVSGTAATDLVVAARDVDARELEGYTSLFARIDITRGTVGARGRFRFNTFGSGGPLLRFTGDVTSSRFSSVDGRLRQELLSWDRLDIKDLEYDYAPARTRVREIALTRPYLRFILGPDLTTNIQGLTVPPDSLPLAFRPAPDAPDTIPTDIGVVRVNEGSMYYADLSLNPNFATGIQSLNGTIKDLSSAQAAHATIDLTGKVDEFAPVKIEGTINPLNSRGLTDVGVSFQNIELTTFTPYSGKFMGYRIRKGKLDLDLRYAIQDRKLKGENKILIRQLSLGEKVESKDATNLPVKFAIALLKDKNGDIDLNLPVHGDLDDPKFSIVPIIMKVLVQLVVKAVTSPFKLFGAIFGGDDEEVTPAIAFSYGSDVLDSLEIKKLDAIMKGLVDRPDLRLEIEPAGQRSRDSLAVLQRRFDHLVRSTSADPRAKTPDPATIAAVSSRALAGIEPADYALRITRAYGDLFGKPPQMEKPKHKPKKGEPPESATVAAEEARLGQMEDKIRASLEITPDEISQLAFERARRVQGYLLRDSTIVPDRIYIVGNKNTYPPDSLGVRVGMTLTE